MGRSLRTREQTDRFAFGGNQSEILPLRGLTRKDRAPKKNGAATAGNDRRGEWTFSVLRSHSGYEAVLTVERVLG